MWPFKSRALKSKEKFQRGCEFAISELQKGTTYEELLNYADNAFDRDEFECGMQHVLNTIVSNKETIR